MSRRAGAIERAAETARPIVSYTLSQLGQETSRRFAELLATTGLEPRQFALLGAVARQEGQSQQAVAGQVAIPTSTMVALVDHLEEEGLIERRPHPSDRRTRMLHLTSKGSSALDKATLLAGNWEASLCAGFNPSERSRLLELLGRVADNLGLDLLYYVS